MAYSRGVWTYFPIIPIVLCEIDDIGNLKLYGQIQCLTECPEDRGSIGEGRGLRGMDEYNDKAQGRKGKGMRSESASDGCDLL